MKFLFVVKTVGKCKKNVLKLIYIKWFVDVGDPNEYSVPETFFFA
jgi:hypothetical protein